MKNKFTFLFILLSICIILTSCSKEKQTDAATFLGANDNEKAPIEAFGTIKSLDVRNFYIRFSTKIQKINVKNGQKVTKGQAIATFDMQEFVFQKKQKESLYKIKSSELKKAQAQLKLKENVNVDSYEIEKLTIDLEAMENEYTITQKDLTIKRQLLDIEAISSQEFKQAENIVNDKKKEIDKIKLSIAKIKASGLKQNSEAKAASSVGVFEIEALKENVQLAKADLDAFNATFNEDYIKDGSIISNVDNGVICNLNYSNGDIVDTTKPLCSIINTKELVAEAYISEEYIKDVKMDAIATMTPVADKSRSFTGKVIYISNSGFEQNGDMVFPVQLSFDNSDGFLQPQFNIDIQINNQ